VDAGPPPVRVTYRLTETGTRVRAGRVRDRALGTGSCWRTSCQIGSTSRAPRSPRRPPDRRR
jgi:hypothetical protein